MPTLPDSVVREAGAIFDDLNAGYVAIRNNADLAPEGRRRQLAAVYMEAKTQLDALKAQWLGGADTTTTVLTKDIFGAVSTAGADAISVRDAADRAGVLADGTEALALLQQADENGDEVLARAIAQQAWRHRDDFFGNDWDPVLELYLSTRPGVAAKMEELASAQKNTVSESFRNEAYFVIGPPPELAMMGASSIVTLAAAS